MKVTRSQVVEGMKIAGSFLVAFVPAILTGMDMISKYGSISNAPDGRVNALALAIGSGLFLGAMFCNILKGKPAVPCLARRSQRSSQHTPRI